MMISQAQDARAQKDVVLEFLKRLVSMQRHILRLQSELDRLKTEEDRVILLFNGSCDRAPFEVRS